MTRLTHNFVAPYIGSLVFHRRASFAQRIIFAATESFFFVARCLSLHARPCLGYKLTKVTGCTVRGRNHNGYKGICIDILLYATRR